MKRPWMPFYISDYLRDTAHLRAAESGAYLHLIMSYWVAGKLPNDDRQLATITRMTFGEWMRARATLEGFFGPGFSSHKRIDLELSKADLISNKRRAAVEQREIKRRSNDTSSDPSNDASKDTCLMTHARGLSQPQSQEAETEKKKDAADAAPIDSEEVAFYRRGKQVLGQSSGGLLKKLVLAKGGSVPLARAAVEQASTKEDPREYIGAIVNGKPELIFGVDRW